MLFPFPVTCNLSPTARGLLGKQPQQFPLKRGEGDFPHRFAGIHQDVPAARKVSLDSAGTLRALAAAGDCAAQHSPGVPAW